MSLLSTIQARPQIELLLNPAKYIAGGKSLMTGTIFFIASGVLATMGKSHFDGVLDLHTARIVAPWYLPILEQVFDWLVFSISLLVLAKFIGKTSFRAIDLFGTQPMARGPFLGCLLLTLNPYYQNACKEIAKGNLLQNLTANDTAYFWIIGSGLFMIPFLIWMVTIMYRSFCISCNLKAPRAITLFVTAFIISEIILKVVYLKIL